MKKILVLTLAIALALAAPVWATSFGTDITVYDGVSVGTSGWYGPQEDDEVAPYQTSGQAWDLEGTFLNGNILSIVGGFDFANGNGEIAIGDFFIDSTADAIYGPPAEGSGWGNTEITNSFGWDWVIKFDMTSSTYDVFAIDETAILNSVLYSQNQESNPVSLVSGGQLVSAGNSFGYYTGLTDEETGFTGGYHNAISDIELSFLGVNASLFTHFTLDCGNDNLMAAGKIYENPVPEPATMLLFGIGLLGFAAVGRKKTFNC